MEKCPFINLVFGLSCPYMTYGKEMIHMNSQDITRSIIGTTIDRGLREMSEDPQRSVRKLADLGKRFSKGRFQARLFSLFQELLRNDNSSYYLLINNLLKDTRWENLRTFGLNVGYNGWTAGAKIIRKQTLLRKTDIPWILIFHYNPKLTKGLSLKQIAEYIQKGKELGIFCFFLWQENSLDGSSELLELIEENPDCAFIWQIPDLPLGCETISKIADCDNLMMSLPYDCTHSQENACKLHTIKAFFAYYLFYENSDIIEQISEISNQIINEHCSFLLLIAKGQNNRSDDLAEYIYNLRLEQTLPIFPVDIYSDFAAVSSIISEHPCIFELLSDGQVNAAASNCHPYLFPDWQPER